MVYALKGTICVLIAGGLLSAGAGEPATTATREAAVTTSDVFAPSGQIESDVVFLKHGNCREVAQQVRSLFQKSKGINKATWYEPVNAVLLRAYADEVAQMKKIIALIDVPSPEAPEKPAASVRDVHVLSIEHANAHELKRVLDDVLILRRRRSDGVFRMTVDERTNALLVSASEAELAQVRGLVAQLDIATTRPAAKR